MAKKRKVDEELENSSNLDPEPNNFKNDSDEHEEQQEQQHQEDTQDEQELTKILEAFNKEQLIDLLRRAASNDSLILEEIHRVADRDPAQRKLFAHGLGWETTSEKLREFYTQYGEIEDCNVVIDKVTGKSKGYGFLLFQHRKSAQKALKEPQKKIESRMTACQLASAGPVNLLNFSQPLQQKNPSFHPPQDNFPRKIYVGNVHSNIPGDKLLAFFSKYGEIEEGPLGFDKHTGKAKGYALFIYKTVEGAKKALEEPSKSFEGYQLYCQKATDSNKQKGSAAAAAPPKPGGSEFNVPSGGGGGYNVNAPHGAMSASHAVFGPHFIGGAQPFGQDVQPIQAALAVLAAAGQNPAAFGVSPAVVASLNPALAAALNAGQPAVGSSTMQHPGFGMLNPGYQNPHAHQANNSYQSGAAGQGPAPRPYSDVGPMGGYATH